jgi:hypothetical protein
LEYPPPLAVLLAVSKVRAGDAILSFMCRPSQKPQVELFGTLLDADNAIAVIMDPSTHGTQRVRIGDDVGGWKVEQIEERNIVISLGDRTAVFTIFADSGPNSSRGDGANVGAGGRFRFAAQRFTDCLTIEDHLALQSYPCHPPVRGASARQGTEGLKVIDLGPSPAWSFSTRGMPSTRARLEEISRPSVSSDRPGLRWTADCRLAAGVA